MRAVTIACFLAFLVCGTGFSKDGPIPATEAKSHVGKTQSVFGTVASAKYLESGKANPTFLNLERPYPDHVFTVLIPNDVRSSFPSPPEDLFIGKVIQVTGKIEDYKGIPQIVVEDPKQISVMETGKTPGTSPVPRATGPAGGGSVKILHNSPLGFNRPSPVTRTEMGITLLQQLASAHRTIDFAIYGIRNQPAILKALLDAKSRGVVVRGVVDADVRGGFYYGGTPELIQKLGGIITDQAVDIASEGFDNDFDYQPFWSRPEGFNGPAQCIGYSLPGNKAIIAVHASRDPIEFTGDIMHHKYFVIDGKTVWTGSCNISDSETGGYSANVGALVESVDVARWYTEEFEQMHQGRFHRQKTALGRKENFETRMDDGTIITAYFSPQGDAIDRAIRPAIQNAQKTINVSVFFLTHKLIAADLINARQRGVAVRVMIDATGATNEYTKHEILRGAGILVKVENWGGKLHSKAACIDGEILVVGSMNWTTAGEAANDENTLVIRNRKLAAEYSGFFETLWASVHDRWLVENPDPESKDSGTSWRDGVDNDFDGLIDVDDPGCRDNPPPLPSLPPYRIVPKVDGYKLIKGVIRNDGRKVYYLPNDDGYEGVRVDQARGERFFPSVWEAVAAGWRKN